MAKFRKRPVVIDATQLLQGHDLIEGLNYGYPVDERNPPAEPHPLSGKYWVQTLEGPLVAQFGDWIITGVKGERYPCKPDVFAATYDPVIE